MRLFHLLSLTAALSLSACAPRALYFHESTKVAFAADYNTSDSQPLATSFGYKRRIVAVVPSQEREIAEGGTERNGTNSGEALSLVSKFNVRAGTGEGVAITNNFASGMAARLMTRSVGSPEALSVLMHSAPIEVSATTGETSSGELGGQVVNQRMERMAGIKRKIGTGGSVSRPGGGPGPGPSDPGTIPANGEIFRDPVTKVLMIRLKNADGTVTVMPLSEFRKQKPGAAKADAKDKAKPEDATPKGKAEGEAGLPANPTDQVPDAELFRNAEGKLMRRIRKPDGTIEEVPFKKP